MKKLKPTPEELEELLKLVHKHNGFIFSDLRVAEQIQRIAKSKGYCVTSDVALTAAYNRQGVIFRIGYILGQRHERAKKAEQERKRAEQERKRAARNGCIFIHRTGASGTAPIIRGAIRGIVERERQHIEEIIKGGLTDENDRG